MIFKEQMRNYKRELKNMLDRKLNKKIIFSIELQNFTEKLEKLKIEDRMTELKQAIEYKYVEDCIQYLSLDLELKKIVFTSIEKVYGNRIIDLKLEVLSINFIRKLYLYLSGKKNKIEFYSSSTELLFLTLLAPEITGKAISEIGNFFSGKKGFFFLEAEIKDEILEIKDLFNYTIPKIAKELVDIGKKSEINLLENMNYFKNKPKIINELISMRLQNYFESFYLGKEEEKIIKKIFIIKNGVFKYDYRRLDKIKIRRSEKNAG